MRYFFTPLQLSVFSNKIKSNLSASVLKWLSNFDVFELKQTEQGMFFGPVKIYIRW